jgi:hypothetical protein
MINLIPPSARKSVIREYWLRVISVWLFLFGTGCLIISVFLLPTYMMVHNQTVTLGGQVSATANKTASYDESIATLTKATAQANFLKGAASTTPFSSYLKTVESLAGTGIALHSVNYAHAAVGGDKITISGTAATREGLATFRDALEAAPEFVTVVLPIASLAQATNVLFSMDITLATSTP